MADIPNQPEPGAVPNNLATGQATATTVAAQILASRNGENPANVGIRHSVVITNTAENVDLTRSFAAQVVAGTTAVATGDGQLYVLMPSTLNGWNLVRAEAAVVTAGTGAGSFTEIQLHNVTDSTDILSTKIKIAAGSTVGAVGVVDNGAIATNDVIRVDVDAINTGAPQGLMIVLEFQAAAGANTIYVGTSTAQNFAIQGGKSIVIDSTAAIFAKTTTGTAPLSFAETYFTTG